jgi:hypothetical protein|nr:hypothetical protein [Kofleriaceae bacterium]
MTRFAVAVAVAAAAAACGPSSGEVRFAHAQAYHAEMTDMVAVAAEAGKPAYVVHPIDEPQCPVEVWKECVWQIALAEPTASEPALTVELHRNADHQVMVEVEPGTADQKQADHMLYRIFEIGKRYIPQAPPRQLHR